MSDFDHTNESLEAARRACVLDFRTFFLRPLLPPPPLPAPSPPPLHPLYRLR